MPRTGRALIDGAAYHISTRGNNGQTVFHQDADYQHYLRLLSTYTQAHQLKIYHFALMPHAVHLLLDVTTGAALSKAMLGLNLAYALFYQKRHRYSGHVWQGRFKSAFVDRERELLACGRSIELEPVRAGLASHPGDYAWSSYRAYADGCADLPVTTHPLYEQLGACADERRARYRRLVEERLAVDTIDARPLVASSSFNRRMRDASPVGAGEFRLRAAPVERHRTGFPIKRRSLGRLSALTGLS